MFTVKIDRYDNEPSEEPRSVTVDGVAWHRDTPAGTHQWFTIDVTKEAM